MKQYLVKLMKDTVMRELLQSSQVLDDPVPSQGSNGGILPLLNVAGASSSKNNNDGMMPATMQPVGREKRPTLVLLINSLGRGGSTFTAEVISTFYSNSFYLFEPLYLLQRSGSSFGEENTIPILKSSFECDFTGKTSFFVKN